MWTKPDICGTVAMECSLSMVPDHWEEAVLAWDGWEPEDRFAIPFRGNLESIQLGVNEFLTFRRDEAPTVGGHRDQWALPGGLMQGRSGDCEDFALLKFALVRHYRPLLPCAIVVIDDLVARSGHAALFVWEKVVNDEATILDNRVPWFLPEHKWQTNDIKIVMSYAAAGGEPGKWYLHGIAAN